MIENKFNKYSNYFFRSLLLLIIIFISSDVFLVIEIREATIRLSYILFFLILIFWVIWFVYKRNIKIPLDRSYIPLLFFCLMSFISALNSVFPLKSLIYTLWTLFSSLTIVFLVWFARKDKTPLPGFDQDKFVMESNAENWTKQEMIDNYIIIRKSTIALFEKLPEEALARVGIASDSPMSVAALGFICCGHQKHHRNIIRERYL